VLGVPFTENCAFEHIPASEHERLVLRRWQRFQRTSVFGIREVRIVFDRRNIAVRPFVDLGEYNVRGVFDTMRVWCCGDRRGRASLDDIAWTLGIESSKTEDVEGSRIFEFYQRLRSNRPRCRGFPRRVANRLKPS
jgi:hypothetical protein